jgi:hypothetical protein
LFQLEAPGDGDGAVTGITVEGEPADTREVVEAQVRADPLLEDAEAVVEADTEV